MSDPAPTSPTRAPLSAYWELTKPGITGLILLMAVAGFFAGDPPYPPPWRALGLLLVSGGLASAGAAALNHWYDRDLDAQMARTRGRPIPSAQVPSVHVLALGTGLTAASYLLAYLTLSLLALACIASGTFVYVVVYTFWLKRRTRWNIVIGGYAGSAPVLAGCAVAAGALTPAGLLLALLVFLWTPPHFWSLALALRKDYAKVGLPMLPVPNDLPASGRTVFVSALLLVLVAAGFLFLPSRYLLFAGLALALGAVFAALCAGLLTSVERPVALRGFIFSGIYLIGIALAMVGTWALRALPGVP